MLLATWNMEGGDATIETKWNACVLLLLTQTEADAVCVQECGDKPPSADSIAQTFVVPDPLAPWRQTAVQCHQWGTSRTTRFVTSYRWDVDGDRSDLAIVSGRMPEDVRLLMGRRGVRRRPVLGVRLGGTWVFTLRAVARGGADAPGLVRAVMNSVGDAFVIAGDFNADPEVLRPLLPPATTLIPPGGNTYTTTYPTARYDYLVAPARTAVSGGTVLTGLVYSDHFPVLFGV
jgi:cytolethal distending toxin subunit B